ncbi:MAG: hypothetical protein HOP97_00770, partial [Terrabacter sp.]|nr:hypothetical protein [Terrabacter sp.]
ATLHGPWSSAGQAACTGPAVGSVSGAVSADGSYPMPSVTVAGGGYYAWRVAIDGTDISLPVAGCGATVKVLARPGAGISWSPAAPAANDNVLATASVSGIPFPAQVRVRITLYQDAVCGTSIQASDLVRSGNGTVSIDFFVPTGGTYSWRAEVSSGDLWVGAASACRTMSAS